MGQVLWCLSGHSILEGQFATTYLARWGEIINQGVVTAECKHLLREVKDSYQMSDRASDRLSCTTYVQRHCLLGNAPKVLYPEHGRILLQTIN